MTATATTTGRPPDRAPGHPAHMAPRGGSFTGTRALLRLAARRDRVLVPVWVAVFVLSAWSTAASTIAVYPDQASRATFAASINASPSSVALYGRIWDVTSLGATVMFKMNAFGAAMVALLMIFLVVRHTRAEEETGRLELVGAGVVGRHAALAAALGVGVGTSLVLALLTSASLVAAGLPAGGAAAFGASWALAGIVFAAIAALVAQLTGSARAATGIGSAVLGVTYVLRATGDVADETGPRWLTWLSPIGWSQEIRAFAGDRWWVLGIGLVAAALIATLAVAVADRRDLGAGLLADRPGPARAGAVLGGPFGLAFRLHRGALVAWSLAFATLGAVAGGLAGSLDAFLQAPNAREMILKLGGQSGLEDAFFSTELGAAGIVASVYAVQVVNRLHAEEAAGHGELLLATALGRRRWALSHATTALAGAAWLLAVAGLVMGITAASSLADPSRRTGLVGSALLQLPAVLVMIGIALAGFGLLPRGSALGWALLVAFLLIGELGPLIGLDQWVLDLSPFAHVPRVGADVDLLPLAALTAVGLALGALGLAAFRRRDAG